MINAENLIFRQERLDLVVELLGRFQIIAKRFLKYNSAPLPVLLAGELGGAQLFNYAAEKCRAGGQVKEIVAMSMMVLIGFAQRCGELGIDLGVLEFPGN